MVTTWCEQPVPFPKKLYFCTLQGADRGITDASLTIDFAMRPYEPPTSAKLAQWRNPEFHPNQRHSGLEVTFPLEHPLAEPEYFVSWVNELAALKSCRFISGTAGYGIDFPENAPTAAARTQSRERAGALLQRYPGLDLAGRRTGSPILLRRDMDYLGFTGMAVGKPYLKRANWLNFLSEGQVAFLGGLPALRKQLAPLPAIKIVEFAHGIMIQAGQRPQLGDITVNRIPAEYAAVAKAVAPVRVPSMNPSSMGDWFGDEGANLLAQRAGAHLVQCSGVLSLSFISNRIDLPMPILWKATAEGKTIRYLEANARALGESNPDFEWPDPIELLATFVAHGFAVPLDGITPRLEVVEVKPELAASRQHWHMKVDALHPGYARVLDNLLRAPGTDDVSFWESTFSAWRNGALKLLLRIPQRHAIGILSFPTAHPTRM